MSGRLVRFAAALVSGVVLLAAGAAEAAPSIVLQGDPPEFRLEGAEGPASARPDSYRDIFRVGVQAADLQPMAGSYRMDGGALVFQPQFPLEPGVAYRAEYSLGGERAVASFAIPRPVLEATTEIEGVYPSAGLLPQNQLKLYIHFSAPMSRGGAFQRLKIAAEDGTVVQLPFLSLAEELWDAEYRRLTVLFDPGRIKRGLVPNQELGLALREGHRYTLLIDQAWPDARGVPLRTGFAKSFAVGPEDRTPLDPKDWRLAAPAAGTIEALVIDFPEPLDHALLERVLSVTDEAGNRLEGAVFVERDETRWTFIPQSAWTAGNYEVRIPGLLEDLAGNKIYTPFDVDVLQNPNAPGPSETYALSFRAAAGR